MTHENWQKALFAECELYRVGGSVRDELMGIPHGEEDVDYLVRGIAPDRLEKLLSEFGRIVLVGKSFGVYKFKPTGEDFEHDIAFPRKEVSTGPGHREFEVKWEENLPVEVDLRRRDFTINAIAQRVEDGSISDPFGGREDIHNRRLRMIFPEAFREDPLRIMRGIRFAARFSLTTDDDTASAMREAAGLLDSLSAERIQEEFNKLFSQCDTPSTAFSAMHGLSVLEVVLPELARTVGVEQNQYHPDDVFWHSVKSCDRAPRGNRLVRWAALMHDLGKVDCKKTVDDDGGERVVFYGHEKVSAEIAEKALERLRYGRDFIARCTHLVRNHMYFYQSEWNRATVRRFIRTIGEDNLDDLLALRKADLMSRGLSDRVAEVEELRRRVLDELDSQHALKLEDMAIDGRDVMSVLGIGAGEDVGRILHELFDRVLENPSLNKRETLLKILRTYEKGR